MGKITKSLSSFGKISLSLVSGFTSTLIVLHSAEAFTVTKIDFLGQSIFPEVSLTPPTPTGFPFEGTLLGGLSGITYDASQNVYYSISDDRSQFSPARFYTLQIDLTDGSLTQGGVNPVDVTTLLAQNGQPFPSLSLDPEAIALTSQGTLFVASEGDANNLISPFIKEFSLAGEQLNTLPVPSKFLPSADRTSGIRNNLAFESLTITPNQNFLFAATENALFQDGPAAGLATGSPSRILKYDLESGQAVGEFLYNTDPVALSPNPATGFNTNGLVELLALDNQGNNFLALERSFSAGALGTPGNTGNTIKLYQVSLEGATNISGINSLTSAETADITPATKKLLLDFTSLGIPIDNIEGLTFGPDLADGRKSLIVVSDNNFSEPQFTQVLAFGITTQSPESVPEPSAFAGLALLILVGLGTKRR